MSDFQAASEDSSGGIADPPPESVNLDIECLDDSFVAAGCLSLFKLAKLAEAPGRSKDTFSTFHRGDGCGKPLSQLFSFGETIRLIFLGEAGTGKTHLSTGLTVAACRQRLRVQFTTAAELVNELTEAKKQSELNRVTARWMRYELIVVDEMAYVAMPEAAAEYLF